MKKFISVILILCIMFSCAVTVTAYAEDGEEQQIIQEDEQQEQEKQETQYVAKMYICSRIIILGHVWLYFENLTDENITIGCYNLEPEQGVSVGTFLFTRYNGGGIYYNIETYCGHKHSLKRTVSQSMMLTKEQLEKVNKKILASNSWTPFTNCGLFATKVWNSVSDRHIPYAVFPILTKIAIKRHNEGVPNFFVPSKEQCFRQKGRKDKARLKQVNGASLLWGIGY